jgi:hypothetical protein
MNKLVIGASLLILLCFIVTGMTIVQAQAVVGVSQGDVFEYDMVSYWNPLFTGTPPAELLELNRTEWIRVTVTGVSGSQISTRTTTRYLNGTEISSDGVCDIETGVTEGGPPFIGANLGVSDSVTPSADSDPWYVNETVTRTYKDGSRETNHLNLEYTGSSADGGDLSSVYDYYFDKSTGVLVEYNTEFSQSELTTITRSKLVSSSVWVVPEFPALIIIPLFVMVTLFAVAAKKRHFHRLP